MNQVQVKCLLGRTKQKDDGEVILIMGVRFDALFYTWLLSLDGCIRIEKTALRSLVGVSRL